MKRKPKVVEAWAVLDDDGSFLAGPSNSQSEVEKEYRRRWGEDCKATLFVPAGPHAKLKADVVRAAEKLMGGLPTEPHDTPRADAIFWARFDALGRAISKLQKVKP